MTPPESLGIWQLGRKRLDCTQPRLVAIVNATPDSFHAASRLPAETSALRTALQALLATQPDVVDIGGQSSRPGSARLSAADELSRVLPVIAALRQLDSELPLTIDTYSAQVARAALAEGVDGVNDISAGSFDPQLLAVVAESGCGYVLMHMQGTPETMQHQPQYTNCLAEVGEFLACSLERLVRLGIAAERVVLDPGIGFGKRVEDNLELIRHAARLRELGRPLLYGISRKMFVGKLSQAAEPEQRLPGTLGLTWELLNQGVMLHRVHDSAEVKQVFRLWQALRGVELGA